jgi:hypothetical protein
MKHLFVGIIFILTGFQLLAADGYEIKLTIKGIQKGENIQLAYYFGDKQYIRDSAKAEAGGKIVLTDRPCIYKGVTHDKLNFVYNYGTSGGSSEGCWGIEGEVVAVIWFDSEGTMRYPLTNFVINPNYKGKNRNRSTL